MDGTVSSYPVEGRYAWPSELDLMARLAGMRLRERWAGWKREPFTEPQRLARVRLREALTTVGRYGCDGAGGAPSSSNMRSSM